MGAGVAAGGVVAAADVPALQADAQVQPDAALAQAVLAAVDGGGQLGHGDGVQVGAGGGPGRSCLSIAKSSSHRGNRAPPSTRTRTVVSHPGGGQRRDGVQPSVLELELEADAVLERRRRGSRVARSGPAGSRLTCGGPGEQRLGRRRCERPSKPRKRATHRAGRALEQLPRRPVGDQLAVDQDQQPVGQRPRLGAVVDDDERRPRRPSAAPRRASSSRCAARLGVEARRTARRAAGCRGCTAIARARCTRRRSPPERLAAGRAGPGARRRSPAAPRARARRARVAARPTRPARA